MRPNLAHFKIRMSEPPGRHILYRNDVPVFSGASYLDAAVYAETTYHLSPGSLRALYRDYHEDLEHR